MSFLMSWWTANRLFNSLLIAPPEAPEILPPSPAMNNPSRTRSSGTPIDAGKHHINNYTGAR